MDVSIRKRVLQLNRWLETGDAPMALRMPEQLIVRQQIGHDVFHDTRRATLILGPRQAGKSTFVWSWLRDQPAESVMFLLGEEERVRAWCRSPTQFLTDLRSEFPTVRTIFIEEAQQLDEAGLFIKGLVDAPDALNVIATGSGAFHLEARTRESLAGRATRRRLLPLSTVEILDSENHRIPAVRSQREHGIMLQQVIYGSYPAVWRSKDPENELRELVEAFVIRDASDRFHLERPDALRQLLLLAASQAGQMINLSEWASLAGVAASTVADYLAILTECWVVAQVPPFAGGKRREITHARRVHFFDAGLRNVLLQAFQPQLELRPDAGALMETYVFGELCKALPIDATVRYWRAKGGAEVDFIIQYGGRLACVEVKASGRPKLTRSLRSFLKVYDVEVAVVACGVDERTEHDELPVVFAPATQVAAEVLTALGL